MSAAERPVTASELAERILRVTTETVYRMARRGDIPFIRVGRTYRFYPEQVMAKLSAPKPSWSQSARSRGRKRVI